MYTKYSRVEIEEAFIFPRKIMLTGNSYRSVKTTCFCPSQFGSVVTVLAHGPKGYGHDSSQGHLPCLQAQSLASA